MGTTKCAYVGCVSRTGPLGKVSMFRFPVANKRRVEIWLENCGDASLRTLKPDKLRNRVICIKHFDDKYIRKAGQKKRLTDTAIPRHYNDTDIGQDLSQDEETPPEFQVLKPTRVYMPKQMKAVLEEPEILVDFGKLRRRQFDKSMYQITTETIIDGSVAPSRTITDYDMDSIESDEDILSEVEFESEDQDSDVDPLATETHSFPTDDCKAQLTDLKAHLTDSMAHLTDSMAHLTDPMVHVTDVGKVLEPTFGVDKPMSEANETRPNCVGRQKSNDEVPEHSNIEVNADVDSVPLDIQNKYDEPICPILFDESRFVDPHIGKISVPTVEPPSNEADHVFYDEYINKPWRTRWLNDDIERPIFVYSEQKKTTKVTVYKTTDKKMAKSLRSRLNSFAEDPKRKQAEENVKTYTRKKNSETNVTEKNGETNVSDKSGETNVTDKSGETNVTDKSGETNVTEKNSETNVMKKNIETNIIEKNVEINMRNESSGKPRNSKEYWKTKLTQILHSTKFCGVCLSIDDDVNSVYDQFEIVVCERSHAATLADILRVVFTETEDLLANSQICKCCIDKLIKSYMFIKQTRERSKILNSHINDLYKKSCYIRNNVLNDSNHEQAEASKVMIELDSTLVPNYYYKDKDNIDNDDVKVTEDNTECNDSDTDDRVENSEVDTEKEINNVAVIIPEDDAINVNVINDSFANGNYVNGGNNSLHGIYSDGLDNCKDDKYRDNNEDDNNSRDTHVEETELANNDMELENNQNYEGLQGLTCPICNETLKNEELVAHLKDHLNERCLRKCRKCNVAFYTAKEWEEHKQMWHYGEGSKCLICLESYSEVEQEQHRCRFGCGSCAEMPCVHHKYLMYYREKILNGAIGAECLDCQYVGRHKQALLIHVNKSHLKYRPFSCKICKKKFHSKYDVTKHMNRHNPNKVYKCRHCAMEFNNQGLYLSHLKEYRNFQCEYCHKKFSTLNTLDTHKSGNYCRKLKQVPCDLCQKVLPSNSYKNIHMATSHKIPKELKECDICHEKFAYRHLLIKHVLSHRSDEKYCCKDCKIVCSSLREYEEHRRIHFGLCELCGKEMEQSFLKTHINKKFCQKST